MGDGYFLFFFKCLKDIELRPTLTIKEELHGLNI